MERQSKAVLQNANEQLKQKLDTAAAAKDSQGAEIVEKGKDVLKNVEDKAKKNLGEIGKTMSGDKTEGGSPTMRLSQALIMLVMIIMA